MKKETVSPKKGSSKLSSDENTSPVRKPNTMMMNWLSKSASKKTDDHAKIKKVDANAPLKKVDGDLKKLDEKSLKIESKKKASKVVESSDEEPSPIKLKAKKEKQNSKKVKMEEEFEEKKETKKHTNKSILSPKEKEKDPPAKKGGNKYYAAYMRRDGPKNPGSKPVPIGKSDCFAGLKFLVTGVLDSLDRDEFKKIVEKYGGSCISGVTKKLDYLIVGEDAGEAKIQKAKELNVKQISEDEFLQLICNRSGISNPKYEQSEVEMMIDETVIEPEVKQEIKAEKNPTPKKEKTTPVKHDQIK